MISPAMPRWAVRVPDRALAKIARVLCPGAWLYVSEVQVMLALVAWVNLRAPRR